MRNLGLVLFTGLALVGCSSNNSGDDDDGSGVTPTASGVFPAQGFSGRDLRVEITGDATTWSSTTTVSFGAGVTVNSIAAASPTDLFADISIDPTAAAGLQDVTVTDGTSTFKLSQAFEIDAPAAIAFAGSVAQGSISEFTITSVDIANPFDTTSTSDIFGDVTYTNIAFSGPAGVGVSISTVTSYSITGLFLTDVDATAGAADFEVASGPAGGTIVMTDVGTVNVAARTATALTAGTATTGNVGAAFDSQLYSYTPLTPPDVTELSVTTANTDASAQVAILPSSGHFADLISFGGSANSINTAAGGQYLVYWDNTGTTGYSYALQVNDTALTHTTALTATEDTDTLAAAVTSPAYLTNGNGATTSGFVWVKFTVAAGDVGKVIHVINAGDAVMVFNVFTSKANADAANPVIFSSGEFDLVTGTIATAGTYYVQMQEDVDNSVGDDFTAAVFLEPAPE